MAGLYKGVRKISNIDLSNNSNVVIKIDDGIIQVGEFIDYLNNSQINISNYKNMIVYFESFDYNDAQYYDFIVIPTNYDLQGLLIDNNSYLYQLICDSTSGSLVYRYERIGGGDLTNYYTKTEIDTKFGDYYDRDRINLLLNSWSTDFYNKSAMKLYYYTKTETDTKLDGYYTKTEADSNLGSYYTKTEIDTKLDGQGLDLTNYYTKTEINTKFGDYYTKGAIDNKTNTINTEMGAVASNVTTLSNKIADIETTLGEIDALLNDINGEVI